ncbi:MAG: hypothetical protein CMM28_10685 [Rhodospirillaceae bacterium]|nr:hypothetical protein [Rhodospirillaceae bacterium]|tara:strand:- start:199 stop:759 length:561 start_codon:yes stop_codon:yes gene_type:complete
MSARNNFISGLVMLVVTLVFFIQVFRIEEDPFGHGMDPDTFPLSVCITLLALTVGFVISSFFVMRKENSEPMQLEALTVLGRQIANLPHELNLFVGWVLPMSMIAFAYLGLMNLFQYLIPSILCLSATLALFGNRGVKWLVIIPTVSMTIYYIIFFGILRLSEPRGALWEYDNFYIFGTLRKLMGV